MRQLCCTGALTPILLCLQPVNFASLGLTGITAAGLVYYYQHLKDQKLKGMELLNQHKQIAASQLWCCLAAYRRYQNTLSWQGCNWRPISSC